MYSWPILVRSYTTFANMLAFQCQYMLTDQPICWRFRTGVVKSRALEGGVGCGAAVSEERPGGGGGRQAPSTGNNLTAPRADWAQKPLSNRPPADSLLTRLAKFVDKARKMARAAEQRNEDNGGAPHCPACA